MGCLTWCPVLVRQILPSWTLMNLVPSLRHQPTWPISRRSSLTMSFPVVMAGMIRPIHQGRQLSWKSKPIAELIRMFRREARGAETSITSPIRSRREAMTEVDYFAGEIGNFARILKAWFVLMEKWIRAVDCLCMPNGAYFEIRCHSILTLWISTKPHSWSVILWPWYSWSMLQITDSVPVKLPWWSKPSVQSLRFTNWLPLWFNCLWTPSL